MPLTSDALIVLEIEHMVLEANKSRRWSDLKETHACQQERDRRADREREMMELVLGRGSYSNPHLLIYI